MDIIIKKCTCSICGYVYDLAVGDPDNEIAPGTKWEDVPEDWYVQYGEQQKMNLTLNNWIK